MLKKYTGTGIIKILPMYSMCMYPRNISESKNYIKNICLFVKPQIHRGYLTSAYGCNDIWNQRLMDPLTQGIKPIEYFYELLRKHRRDGKIAAIDADIFINSINIESASKLSEEIEETLRLIRRSPETINTLESTSHNAIRLLLSAEKDEDIMKIISDPMNYGVFLDHYLANLLMFSFLTKDNFMAAARVASSLMLQEDYGPRLTQHLVLLSCFSYSYNLETNKEWVHYNEVEEPEEEVKVVVQYIRNYYFDDHFDLRIPAHIVGKTLVWLAPHMDKGSLKTNTEVLGWGLYEKWTNLGKSLNNIVANSETLDEHVHSIISSRLEKCDDLELKAKLMASLSGLKSRGDIVKDLDLLSDIKALVKDETSKTEKEDIAKQITVYDDFIKIRKVSFEKQKELYERTRLMAEIEDKKSDLKGREEIIFFFENEDQIDVELETKRRMYPEDEITKKSSKEEENEYVPPEIRYRGGP